MMAVSPAQAFSAVNRLAIRPASRRATTIPSQSTVLPLPGGLNTKELLNSNHPEIVRGPGIALSTLQRPATAHLPHTFNGEFDIFSHHVNGSSNVLHGGVVLHNPGQTPAMVTIKAGADVTGVQGLYFNLGRAINRVLQLVWQDRDVTSGPGGALARALLNGTPHQPATLTLKPGEYAVLATRRLKPSRTMSTQWRLHTDKPVNAAIIFDREAIDPQCAERVLRGDVRIPPNPNDKLPTPPEYPGKTIYGRVAGIQRGTLWKTTLHSGAVGKPIVVGDAAQVLQWAIATKKDHLLGTGQDQTATLTRRMANSAYAAHGNYGIEYDLDMPLHNTTDTVRHISLALNSPEPTPGMPIAFSGPIELSWQVNDQPIRRVVREVNVRPEQTRTLWSGTLPARATGSLRVRLIYPADSTPPQILQLHTR